jgi:subtilisin family serine protease
MKQSLWFLFLSTTVAMAQDLYTFTENGTPHSYRLAGARSGAILFHDQAALPSRARLNAMPPAQRTARLKSAERWLTAKVLVPKGQSRTKPRPVQESDSLLEGWTLLTYADPSTAFEAIQAMQRQGLNCQPVFARQHVSRQATNFGKTRQREVNDPLFPKQWHLGDAAEGDLAGGLNLRAAWDHVTGKGINVVVADDGLEIGHVDLKENTYPLESGYHRNFNDGPEGDPNPTQPDAAHGTSCAGIVAARGFNHEGLTGVAPEARLMGIRIIAGPSTDDAEGLSFNWQPEGTIVHVSSNSWGPNDDGFDGGRQGPMAAAGMAKAATANRDGRGTVVVFSAGNGRREGDDSSFDAYASSRFAIAVGAVNRTGEPSSYSEQGMNVAVSAFGGEFAPPDVIWTTHNSGAEAQAHLREAGPSQAPVDYTDSFNGTSAAAPQVSGAVALLLERNPQLHYRDVKEILMSTARRTGLKDGDPFTSNGGGFPFSHSFGAGLIDVAKALEAADSWTSLGPLVEASRQHAVLNVPIPDGEGAGENIKFELADSNLRVEHVEVTVTVAHPLRGDLGFVLVSPSGMRSVAKRRPHDDTADFTAYTFTSVRHWGESSSGTWELQVSDNEANGLTGTIKAASLKVYGTAR